MRGIGAAYKIDRVDVAALLLPDPLKDPSYSELSSRLFARGARV